MIKRVLLLLAVVSLLSASGCFVAYPVGHAGPKRQTVIIRQGEFRKAPPGQTRKYYQDDRKAEKGKKHKKDPAN